MGYCFSVKAGDSCPSRSLMALTGTPAFNATVACMRRKSCNRIGLEQECPPRTDEHVIDVAVIGLDVVEQCPVAFKQRT